MVTCVCFRWRYYSIIINHSVHWCWLSANLMGVYHAVWAAQRSIENLGHFTHWRVNIFCQEQFPTCALFHLFGLLSRVNCNKHVALSHKQHSCYSEYFTRYDMMILMHSIYAITLSLTASCCSYYSVHEWLQFFSDNNIRCEISNTISTTTVVVMVMVKLLLIVAEWW